MLYNKKKGIMVINTNFTLKISSDMAIICLSWNITAANSVAMNDALLAYSHEHAVSLIFYLAQTIAMS